MVVHWLLNRLDGRLSSDRGWRFFLTSTAEDLDVISDWVFAWSMRSFWRSEFIPFLVLYFTLVGTVMWFHAFLYTFYYDCGVTKDSDFFKKQFDLEWQQPGGPERIKQRLEPLMYHVHAYIFREYKTDMLLSVFVEDLPQIILTIMYNSRTSKPTSLSAILNILTSVIGVLAKLIEHKRKSD
jgi:hypothetical protein